MANRWWVYQRERFPVLAHGTLIMAFSLSAMSFSKLLRGETGLFHVYPAMVAFISAFLFFFQLRVADEFKDFEEDARYRPYRPVPRGLVKLRELGLLGIVCGLIQLVLALSLNFTQLLLLIAVWIYMGLMFKEFFIPDWLKARPFTYMWTHILVIPLINVYATACDWNVAGTAPPDGLVWFLVVSFFSGMVIEIGRKIRGPEEEEEGVETYSVLWGRRNAVLAWLAALMLTTISAWRSATLIDFSAPLIMLLSLLFGVALLVSWRFLHHPTSRSARFFEPVSGLWTLLMYLSLGAVPLLLRIYKGQGL